ncbi:hypothetical protein D3C77_388470 [compost metagenome]
MRHLKAIAAALIFIASIELLRIPVIVDFAVVEMDKCPRSVRNKHISFGIGSRRSEIFHEFNFVQRVIRIFLYLAHRDSDLQPLRS